MNKFFSGTTKPKKPIGSYRTADIELVFYLIYTPARARELNWMGRRAGKHQPKITGDLSSQDPMSSELAMEQSLVGIKDILRLSHGHLPQRHQTTTMEEFLDQLKRPSLCCRQL